MPYKDYEKQKEYQRKRYRRIKQGLPGRITPILSEEERRNISLKKQRARNNKYRNKKKDIISSYLGDSCFFCDYKRRLVTHRKDGNSHEKLINLKINLLKQELETNNYVYVCYKCHKAIHWCMIYLGFDWDKLLGTREEKTTGSSPVSSISGDN